MAVDVETKKGTHKMIPYYLGGRFSKEEIDKQADEAVFQNFKWVDNGPVPKDLLGLIFNIVAF